MRFQLRALLVAFLASAFLASVCHPSTAPAEEPAATAEPPAGHWAGRIDLPNQQLALTVDLDRRGEGWVGAVSIPTQQVKDFPLADIQVDGSKVSFAMQGAPGSPTFSGELAGDGDKLAGTFVQFGHSVPFSLERQGEAELAIRDWLSGSPPGDRALAPLAGDWYGTIAIDGQALRMVLHVTPGDGEGRARATIDSLDQAASGLVVDVLRLDAEQVHLEMSFLGVVYEGRFDAAAGTITGIWHQGGRDLPLKLARVDPVPVPATTGAAGGSAG